MHICVYQSFPRTNNCTLISKLYPVITPHVRILKHDMSPEHIHITDALHNIRYVGFDGVCDPVTFTFGLHVQPAIEAMMPANPVHRSPPLFQRNTMGARGE